jgi:hypothetical protein
MFWLSIIPDIGGLLLSLDNSTAKMIASNQNCHYEHLKYLVR